jgi:hypothetical protein
MSAKKFSFFSLRYKSSNWLSINCTKQKTVPLEISTVLVLPAQEYTSLNKCLCIEQRCLKEKSPVTP